MCASLNETTKHIVDAKFLTRMKESAFLINTSREELVDQEMLFEWGLLASNNMQSFYFIKLKPKPIPNKNKTKQKIQKLCSPPNKRLNLVFSELS